MALSAQAVLESEGLSQHLAAVSLPGMERENIILVWLIVPELTELGQIFTVILRRWRKQVHIVSWVLDMVVPFN